MNKNWPLHFFSVFVGLVWKSINKHIIIPDQKGSGMHWHYLCFYASPEGDLMWMNSIKWYHINFSLSCFISWEKLGHISSCLRMSYCFFSPFTHPYFAPTLEYEWDPRFFAPSRIAAIEVLAENVLYGYHSLASLISFISYVWCVVGHTFFSAFFILKYTTLNNDKKK